MARFNRLEFDLETGHLGARIRKDDGGWHRVNIASPATFHMHMQAVQAHLPTLGSTPIPDEDLTKLEHFGASLPDVFKAAAADAMAQANDAADALTAAQAQHANELAHAADQVQDAQSAAVDAAAKQKHAEGERDAWAKAHAGLAAEHSALVAAHEKTIADLRDAQHKIAMHEAALAALRAARDQANHDKTELLVAMHKRDAADGKAAQAHAP